MSRLKETMLMLTILILVSLITGCVDNTSPKNGTEKEIVDSPKESSALSDAESSGIFSEKLSVTTPQKDFTDISKEYRYNAVYNNGYELEVKYGNEISCSLLSSKSRKKQYVRVVNGIPAQYGVWSNDFAVTWDQEGRVDPRSDSSLINEAKEFSNVCKRKDKEIRDKRQLDKLSQYKEIKIDEDLTYQNWNAEEIPDDDLAIFEKINTGIYPARGINSKINGVYLAIDKKLLAAYTKENIEDKKVIIDGVTFSNIRCKSDGYRYTIRTDVDNPKNRMVSMTLYENRIKASKPTIGRNLDIRSSSKDYDLGVLCTGGPGSSSISMGEEILVIGLRLPK